jgi:hypothetical protein
MKGEENEIWLCGLDPCFTDPFTRLAKARGNSGPFWCKNSLQGVPVYAVFGDMRDIGTEIGMAFAVGGIAIGLLFVITAILGLKIKLLQVRIIKLEAAVDTMKTMLK